MFQRLIRIPILKNRYIEKNKKNKKKDKDPQRYQLEELFIDAENSRKTKG